MHWNAERPSDVWALAQGVWRWQCGGMMRKAILPAAGAAAIALGIAVSVSVRADRPALSPGEIVQAAPAAQWTAIPPEQLLVMDLAPGTGGKPRRVVIQLMPAPFSQGWVGNVRKLAAAHWWDGTSINRVQDNYVVQWGDGDAEDAAKAKPLPAGLAKVPQADYVAPLSWSPPAVGSPGNRRDEIYGGTGSFKGGWPIASDGKSAWPVHCYGMVGVGRSMPPDTGTGAELYVVIGHAPRQLDGNIALVGRVIEGIEHLSSLPRGTAEMGFYQTAGERVPIVSTRLGNEVVGLPAYEYLSTQSASFTEYADARANRRDAFFIRPAGGADICNVPVPVRRVKS